MAKALIVSGHPDYKNSLANRNILDEVHRLLPAAEIIYLDALYPDFRIDVATEQERLVKADTIVFQFPIWWYSYPSLMACYVEQAFSFGFAYGPGGRSLQGKRLFLSFTTGSPEAAYSPEGAQRYKMGAFLTRFFAIATLTGLFYAGSVISYGMALMDPSEETLKKAILARTKEHAAKLVKMIG